VIRHAHHRVLILLSLACTSALAQTPDARRRIYRTQDGFLQVDPRTGAITECKRGHRGHHRCQQVREKDPLLQEEPGLEPPWAQRRSR
jgi:hypothetical protein